MSRAPRRSVVTAVDTLLTSVWGPSPRLHATVAGRTRPCLVRNAAFPQQLQIGRPLSPRTLFCVGVPSMRNPGDYPHSAYHYRRSFTQFVAQQIARAVSTTPGKRVRMQSGRQLGRPRRVLDHRMGPSRRKVGTQAAQFRKARRRKSNSPAYPG